MTANTSSHSRLALALGFLALGLAAGVGGTWYALKRAPSAAPDNTTKAPAQKQLYQCPMHPQVIMDHEGDCPICGMKLVPMEAATAPTPPAQPADKGKLLFYRNPMDPSITSPVFKKDEMGMDYLPVYENEVKGETPAVDGHGTVTIDTERQQLIGLKTAKVVEGSVSGEIRTNGRVAIDETRVRKINVKVEGFVERLFVDFVGKPVGKGQALFSLYSPEFVSAQQEYLLALKTKQAMSQGSFQTSGSDLLESARRRLQFWDVPQEAIDRLEKTGEPQRTLTLRSPVSGVVTVKNVVEGSRITPADMPFEITDLSRVWVLADAYETDLGRAKVGMTAELTLQSVPDHTFKGRVAFIDPVLDPKTRTAKLRIEFPNPKGELRPESFGEVVLKGQGKRGLLVPRDAVMDSGTTKVAFIALGNGRFEPREVTTGASLGEQVEILQGLKVGDEVVTRANFLVDSESRLRAALAQMGAQSAQKP
jgi:membrane fusion protein, copper/silver efflux system